jgi:hypothetical protein
MPNSQLTVALIGASAALLGTIVGAGVALWATAYAQRHQDRREKHQRVHACFQRVLMAAKWFASMTAPFQRGGGGAWTPEQEMAEEYRQRFHEDLQRLKEGLRNAAVDLTLEGHHGAGRRGERTGHEVRRLPMALDAERRGWGDLGWRQGIPGHRGDLQSSRAAASGGEVTDRIRRDCYHE